LISGIELGFARAQITAVLERKRIRTESFGRKSIDDAAEEGAEEGEESNTR